jgi:microcystin-dependent protein
MSSQGNPNLQGFPQTNAPVVDPATGYQWTTFWLRFMMSLWQRTGAASGSGVVYTGIISAFGAAPPPLGWLACDGAAVDRIVYAGLFSVIGTTWGVGDGVTTFNIPDLRGKFALGAGVIPIGSSGGTDSVVLSVGNLPAHNHAISDPGHDHTTLAEDDIVTTGTDPGGVTTGGTTGTATTGITTQNTGSNAAFSILPPYAAVIWMIKS